MSPRAPAREIDRAIRSILERDEFRGIDDAGGAEVQAIGEMATALLQAADAFIGDLRTNHPGIFVLLLMGGTIILAVAVWYGARGAARRSWSSASVESEIPADMRGDPSVLRSDAERMAGEGRYLEAVRLLFRAEIIEQALGEGSLESLREAGRFRRAHTYGELVEEFARSPSSRERMRRLADRIEEGLYAGRPLGAEDWDEARRR
jgi:hypothetical protein